ncbi:MAG: L,D-transpeptidase family protein [Gemmatimonas sp.]
MINRSLVRALTTTAALAVIGACLAGCDADQVSLANNAKANQPVPPKLVAKMQEKDMDPQSPILIRLFKEEAELEVWKQNRSGKFALLKTYPICRWSGDLGPKVREGDRQAPEGFYAISPAQMNPQSAYYLSFNTGYPNAYDRSLGRTGSELMVHGDCSSRGCYAMTDEQIAEIYALGRDSFFGGQKAFQFEAFPFRMTPVNMARHRNNPNMPFWRMIKEGYDHFEVTRQEPKVDFCDKHYVFDAAPPPGATHDPVFQASAKCPAYVVPEEIAGPVREKEQRDDAEYAKLVAKGVPVARLNTGIDGGMNRIFAAHVPGASTGLSDGGQGQDLTMASYSKLPGTIPGDVNPPHAPGADEPAVAVAAAPAAPVAASAPATRVASASPTKSSGGFFSGLARKIGLSSATADTTATAAAPPAPAPAKSKLADARHHNAHAEARAKATDVRTAEARQATNRPVLKPSVAENQPASDTAAASKDGLISGAQPIVSANSFDSRFSAMK